MRSLAENKIADIDTKIRTPKAMNAVLNGLTERCTGCGPASECPILESIDSEEAPQRLGDARLRFSSVSAFRFMPKLICPICWPAYAGLLSAVGLGFLVSARNLLVVTALFLIMAVAALAFRARQRRGYGPAVIGIAASAAVLTGKFYLESPAAAYAAVVVLIAASVWNSWPLKETAVCPQCVGTPQGT